MYDAVSVMAIKAPILDVDGTLVETECDGHRVAFNRAFAEAGLDWHWDPEHYGDLLAVPGGKERMLHQWRAKDLRRWAPCSVRNV